VDFIMRKEGITKHEAILKAQELMGETGTMGPVKKKITTNINLLFVLI